MDLLALLLSVSVGVASAAQPITAGDAATLPTLSSSLPSSPDVARAAVGPDVSGKYFGARYYGSKIGRFTTVDPVYTWRENVVDPQRWNRYAYGRNNPLRFVDPDGRDAIPVAFPNYRIATPVGRLPFLGHAGIILVDSHSGATRYYEYGRYDTEGRGLVRRRTVPDVQMGKDGMPTEASMKKLLDSVSRQSGQSGPVEGAYIRSDSYNEMVGYAEGRRQQNQDPNREPYGLMCNNCGTFAKDTLEAGGVDTPSMIDPRPSSYIKELQSASGSRIRYDPSQNKENK